MTDSPLLRVERLTVQAARRAPSLAQGVTFTLDRGERIGVIGRNGVGKSTLLRQVAGLLPAAGDGATIRWIGRDARALSAAELARQRALMPTQPRDRFALPVLALLELAQPQPDAAAVRTVLQAVDAWDVRDRDVLLLSAGQRQRVALAQALLQDTPVLLLDEPVSLQDPGHQRRLADVLRDCGDRALLFCAHDVNWVGALATQLLALGLDGVDGGWRLAAPPALLTAEGLRAVYQCEWTPLRDAAGAAAWMPA